MDAEPLKPKAGVGESVSGGGTNVAFLCVFWHGVSGALLSSTVAADTGQLLKLIKHSAL